MSKIYDAIEHAEKDKRLSREELRLFETRSTQRVTMQRESRTVQSNGKVSISARAMEEYNHLKQSIISLIPTTRPRALLFASSTEDEGNSNVVASFSMVLASAGERLLLVDANLRNPVLHELFAVGKNHGMAELLSGQETLQQVIKPTHVANLSLVTAGSQLQNPSALFEPGKTDAIVRLTKAEADWVLFDAPVISAFNDAIVLSPGMDGVVLVVRAEKTRWEVAQNARERLESGKANILGVVLNDRKLRIPGWIYRRL